MIATLNKRAAVAVAKFVALHDRLSLASGGSVEEIMRQVVVESGLQQALKESGDEGDQDRLANIEELITAGREFDNQNPGRGHLEDFLEQACLVNDTDAWEADDDRVTLMTMHAAKGLEFPVVFVIAVEEGLLPHERSRESPEQLEEERRLLFVGITRAREELHLSLSRYRDFRGQQRMSVPSQFLLELPHEELENSEMLFPDPSWGDHRQQDDERDHIHEDPGPDVTVSDDGGSMGDDTETAAAESDEFEFAPPRAADLRLKTAAAMIEAPPASVDAAATPATFPDQFQQGMVVQHPEYGLGKIMAVNGTGVKRAATVHFASAAGEKKFLLIHSRLTLVRR